MTLRLDGLSAGRGGGTVVHAVDLDVPAGTVHAVVGHNGAGKSTLLDTVAGLVRPLGGRIMLGHRDLTRLPAHRRNRLGIGTVPQGARVFASLTVAEHLAIAHRRAPAGRSPDCRSPDGRSPDGRSPSGTGPDDRSASGRSPHGGWTPAGVLDLLPRLRERRNHRGGQLSGGERQMLAIARALLTQPRLLLLDEPTEGLAPLVAEHIRGTVSTLATNGTAVLLATPEPGLALAIAHDITVLTAGRVSARFAAGAVRAHPERLYAALTPGDPPAQDAGPAAA